MVDQRLIRVEEAAAALGISRAMTYELLRSGALESVQIGRARRVPVEALDAYVARLREQSVPAPAESAVLR